MEYDRDTTTDEPLTSPVLTEGSVVSVEFGTGGTVEGRVVEVRNESPSVTRVVVSPFGEDTEVDTDASRVTVRDPEAVCPVCGADLSERAYRCPSCGNDLVD